MSSSFIFIDGSVYSPVDPYATAMLAHQGKIAWVGQDAGANSIADDKIEMIELEGSLLTPAFVAAGLAPASMVELEKLIPQLLAHGYAAVTLFISAEMLSAARSLLATAGLKAFIYLTDAVDGSAHGVLLDPLGQETPQRLEEALARQQKVSFLAQSPEQVDAALELVEQYDALARLRASFRLDGVVALSDEQIKGLASLGLSVGFSALVDAQDSSPARALVAGVNILLGSNPEPLGSYKFGWELALSFVVRESSEAQISARAAFNALTRGVYRALGESEPGLGQLVPEAPADFARWQVTELMVQTPDSRVAAWSTDPRARIPLLPVLEEGSLPTCLSLYCEGQKVFSK